MRLVCATGKRPFDELPGRGSGVSLLIDIFAAGARRSR